MCDIAWQCSDCLAGALCDVRFPFGWWENARFPPCCALCGVLRGVSGKENTGGVCEVSFSSSVSFVMSSARAFTLASSKIDRDSLNSEFASRNWRQQMSSSKRSCCSSDMQPEAKPSSKRSHLATLTSKSTPMIGRIAVQTSIAYKDASVDKACWVAGF